VARSGGQFLLNGALFGIWASRIPAVAERHELTAGALGLLLLLLAAGAIAAFPVAGWVADRAGAAPVTRWIAVAYVIALGLIGLSGSVWAVAVALFLFGATHGAMDVSMNTWAGEVERWMERPAMSSFHAVFSLGAGLGAGTGYLAGRADLAITPHFIGAGLAIAVLTFWVAQIDWAPGRFETREAVPIFEFPCGPLFLAGLVAFCLSMGEGAMADWSAYFLIETEAVDEARTALGYSVFSLAMVVMRLLGDRVISWAGPTQTARGAGVFALRIDRGWVSEFRDDLAGLSVPWDRLCGDCALGVFARGERSRLAARTSDRAGIDFGLWWASSWATDHWLCRRGDIDPVGLLDFGGFGCPDHYVGSGSSA